MEPIVQEILKFWFDDGPKPRKVWFVKDSNFDQDVRSRFLSIHEQAVAGEFDDWSESPQSCLALVLLLDQFSRNIFRGTPQAFASDPKALSVAKDAIARGFDQQLPEVQRQFFYFPLEHSENLTDQNQAVSLFEQFRENPELQETYDYALRHRAVIERFGRFPHRNQILGRVSTPAEVEFLKQPGSSF